MTLVLGGSRKEHSLWGILNPLKLVSSALGRRYVISDLSTPLKWDKSIDLMIVSRLLRLA